MHRASPLILLGAFALVAWLSLAPVPLPKYSEDLPALLAPFDHVLLYAGLAFVAGMSWPGRRAYTAMLLVICAIGLEIAQSFVPSRAYELSDMLANLIGVCLGLSAVWLMRQIQSARHG